MLEDKINDDLKKALKKKDTLKAGALRFIRAALQNTAIAKRQKSLSDEETVTVLKKAAKQHQESIEAFKKGNRPELAEKEEKELKIVKEYLPEDLTEGEIKQIVAQCIKNLQPQGPQEMGRVMKAVMAEIKGRADGKIVSGLVAGALQDKDK